MHKSGEPTWVVRLSSEHPDYEEVHLYRESGYPDYEVVLVDSESFIRLTENASPSWVVPPVNEWEFDKKAGISVFLKPPGAVPMPKVALVERNFQTVEKRWFFIKHTTDHTVTAISYANGRHRARYMHWAGAKYFPVLCNKLEAKRLHQLCGWTETI